MASFKILHFLMSLFRNPSQFLQSRSPAFFTSLATLTLIFFVILASRYSPANDISFSPRFPASSKFSSERKSSNKKVLLTKTIERSCNIFDGNWVVDHSYPHYSPKSCPFIDKSFNCFRNGRRDSNYQKLRWEPKGCKIPRLDGKDMLEMLRGKRLVFVGDSLNRNMWESLVCILRASLRDKSRVFDISGLHKFKTEGFYAYRYSDYNCSIEFVPTPFLVQPWEMVNSTGARRETLRLDVIDKSSSKYRDADIIIFNTAHWWTHEKTSRGKSYFQEGDYVHSKMNVLQAYEKALRTWAKWIDASIDAKRTRVFFRGYSTLHFRGGQWNSGGSCSGETRPITNDTYLEPYPPMMSIIESVISKMKTPVSFLNVTKMTGYRKDGHPSIFRQPGAVETRTQDCSHWCLPGVPDAWNELLYSSLLMSGSRVS